MKCCVCDREFESYLALATHVGHSHKNLTIKGYYDRYIKNDSNEGLCYCGKDTKFMGINKGYCKHCSTRCSTRDKEVIAKKEKTCIAKYGVSDPSRSDIIKKKKIETCKERYGVDHSSKSLCIREKFKNTCLKKYGVENPNKSKEVRDKIENTNLKKYGAVCSLQNEDVKQKIKNTCLKKYGVSSPLQNKDVKLKIKNSFIKKYGGYSSQNEEIKNKIIKINLDKRLPVVIDYLNTLDIKLLNNYSNNRTILKLQCLICNTVFETCYFSIKQNGKRCPKCYPKRRSVAETEILNFIKNLGFKVMENSKKIIPPCELDIYIPSLSIAIEHNGLYWHSEKVRKDRDYHLKKLEMCNNKNIQLIQIFEDEWLLFKQNIVKNYLKQKLGVLNTEKVYTEQCIIKEIDTEVKNEFLEKYHLQGKDNSNVRLGEFYGEELVAVATFTKDSTAKNLIWELSRYCNAYNIIGIASKLLFYFKNNYEWKEIYSYADRCWHSGNFYKKLGFALEKTIDPNYQWVKGYNIVSSFDFKKKTEKFKKGYSKIWNCGYLKFVLNNY